MGGLALVCANTWLYFFASYHYPALWVLGLALVLTGARVIDRSVKLRIAPEGLCYAAWHSQIIPWSDFDHFRVSRQGGARILQVQPRDPEKFREQLGVYSRFGAWANRLYGRPAFYIDPRLLDVTLKDMLAALKANGVSAA